MKAIELQMPDEIHRKLSNLAAGEQQPLDAYALRKLEEFVRAMESFAELERRAQRASRDKFNEAMSKVPNVPPTPGDDLPRPEK